MDTQPNIFDVATAQLLKQQGMTRAAEKHQDLLDKAREIALSVAAHKGTITSDDVCYEMFRQGLNYDELGNGRGSIFRGWHFTGEYVQSKRPSSHGRMIRCWRRK